MSKTLSKYIAVFHNFDKTLLVYQQQLLVFLLLNGLLSLAHQLE